MTVKLYDGAVTNRPYSSIGLLFHIW